MPEFSPQAVSALAQVVTGGSRQGGARDRIGCYRTGSELEMFMGSCRIEISIGSSSRVPTIRSAIMRANAQDGALDILRPVFEAAVNPHDYKRLPKGKRVHEEALKHLNSALKANGYELQLNAGLYKLVIRADTVGVGELEDAVDQLDLDAVKRDLDRARGDIESDPEGSITSACSIIESVCKTVLKRMHVPLPPKKDISSLVKAVRQQLSLTPVGEELTPEVDADIKTMLSGLANVAKGIGALRTHVGDAHGRADHAPRMDARTASLAINAASTLALYIIETWRQSTAQDPTARVTTLSGQQRGIGARPC